MNRGQTGLQLLETSLLNCSSIQRSRSRGRWWWGACVVRGCVGAWMRAWVRGCVRGCVRACARAVFSCQLTCPNFSLSSATTRSSTAPRTDLPSIPTITSPALNPASAATLPGMMLFADTPRRPRACHVTPKVPALQITKASQKRVLVVGRWLAVGDKHDAGMNVPMHGCRGGMPARSHHPGQQVLGRRRKKKKKEKEKREKQRPRQSKL